MGLFQAFPTVGARRRMKENSGVLQNHRDLILREPKYRCYKEHSSAGNDHPLERGVGIGPRRRANTGARFRTKAIGGVLSRLIGRIRSLGLRRIVVVVGVVVLLVAAEEILREHRYYIYPKRFRTVEPGAIYRGGRQTPRILRKIIEDYQIQTVINLDDKILEKDDPQRVGADRYREEKAIAKEYGLQYYGFIWEGGGIGPFEEYDAVADILASTVSQPVFVHCAAGKKRSNAALAAYWIRRCGYTFEQAVEHLQRDYGLVPKKKPDFLRHLRLYSEYTSRNPAPNSHRTRDGKTQSVEELPTGRDAPVSKAGTRQD